ncbi:hypothetical protein DFH09DRAFT_370871 [Mycena vulgaris]|nr:hypothetical protein DFH09DRAFT_370871 [Mycena vulgaris]
MCRWRHVRNLYVGCGHTCSLPPVEVQCGSVHCKFSPNHRLDCCAPSCKRTCMQYHLFPEGCVLNNAGVCPPCMRRIPGP